MWPPACEQYLSELSLSRYFASGDLKTSWAYVEGTPEKPVTPVAAICSRTAAVYGKRLLITSRPPTAIWVLRRDMPIT